MWRIRSTDQTRPSGVTGRTDDRPAQTRLRVGLVVIELVIAVSATAEGFRMMTDPTSYPLSWLRHTPFTDWFLPGLALFVVVGVSEFGAALLLVTRSDQARRASIVAGAGLIGWIAVQIAWLRVLHPVMQPVIAGAGLVIAVTAARLRGPAVPEPEAATRAKETDMKTLLVTYGTKHGATAEIAEVLADGARSAGIDVDVLPVEAVKDVGSYQAVVVGSAIYAGRWRRSVVRFLKRHRYDLRQRSVWLFHDGPLDDSVGVPQPLPKKVHDLARFIGPIDTVTFGGKLDPNTSGVIAGRMAKRWGGDFRDMVAIRAWGATIGEQLARRGRVHRAAV